MTVQPYTGPQPPEEAVAALVEQVEALTDDFQQLVEGHEARFAEAVVAYNNRLVINEGAIRRHDTDIENLKYRLAEERAARRELGNLVGELNDVRGANEYVFRDMDDRLRSTRNIALSALGAVMGLAVGVMWVLGGAA